MRVSPLFVAVVASSATLSAVAPAHSQTLPDPEHRDDATAVATPLKMAQSLQLPIPGSTPPKEPQLDVPTSPTQPPTAAPPASSEPAPVVPPSLPSITPEGSPAPEAAQPEARVLIGEIVVEGAQGTLEDAVYTAISSRPGTTATRSQLQQDIDAIFATGFFSKVRVEPSDTPLGVRVAFIVEPNPTLQKVQTTGATVLPEKVAQDIFTPQYGKILNFKELQAGVQQLNKWYQDKGYVLAQVVGSPQVSPDGVVTLEIAEGVIEDIQVKYVSKTGEATNEKGKPVKARTKPYVILREMQQKPGVVFNRNTIQADIQRVFGLGIFEDVKPALTPAQDPRKVLITLNVAEKNTRSIAAGAGVSSSSGLFGTGSIQFQNVRGRNQKVGAELQVGERDILFDLSFTDPWIKNDPYRTSYTANIFRRESVSLVFNGDDSTILLPNGDRPRVNRLGTGITFTRPLSKDVFKRAEWVASLGAQYQRIAVRDPDGNVSPRSDRGELLSFSPSGLDDLATVQFGLARDRRNDTNNPTKGSLFRVGTEQSIPIGSGNILLNRVRANYSYFVPVRILRTKKPGQALAFNVQTGGIVGDLPPYEAFALGGSNSVRGYAEGEMASARYFVLGTVEYRFPLFRIVSGALFADAGSDLGSGSSVPGNPSGVRGLPGSGFGAGLGVRINSPLGPIRVDYGVNDSGDGRFHFGIGQRF
jgi:outer membrane protein insertion porin family